MSDPAIVFACRVIRDEWRVERIEDDGSIEVTIFSGPMAERRAREYAEWKYPARTVYASVFDE